MAKMATNFKYSNYPQSDWLLGVSNGKHMMKVPVTLRKTLKYASNFKFLFIIHLINCWEKQPMATMGNK